MRARHLVYHIQCFSCAICNQVLNKGDQFGIRSSAVFCRWVFNLVIVIEISLLFSTDFTLISIQRRQVPTHAPIRRQMFSVILLTRQVQVTWQISMEVVEVAASMEVNI